MPNESGVIQTLHYVFSISLQHHVNKPCCRSLGSEFYSFPSCLHWFILAGFILQQVHRLSKDDPLLQPFYVGPGLSPRLDCCALVDEDHRFCTTCFDAIKRRHPPKFSAPDPVDVSFYHHYPRALEGLTLTEECLIARCHPIASILKLRPNGAYNPGAYNRVRGHIVVFPQDPGPRYSPQ